MATKITYDQFGPAFIKEGLHPQVIQKSLNKAIQPRSMAGTMNQGPVKVIYSAIIKDAQVNYTNQIGVYQVVLPIELDVDVRAVGVISKRYKLNAFVPFQLVAETYAPLVIYINYYEVQPSSVNVSGAAGGGDIIYKKIVETIPGVLAVEVNKALKASHNSRIIDVLKSVNSNALIIDSLLDEENEALVNFPDAELLKTVFDQAPEEITEGINSENDNNAIWNEPSFLTIDETKASFSGVRTNAVRMDFVKFGYEFLRLAIPPLRVQKEINKSLANNNIKSDVSVIKGSPVSYKAIISPATVTAQAFGVFNVNIKVNIDLYVSLLGVWNEAWKITASVPFGMQVVPYSNPLLVYLAVTPVQKGNIRIISQQKTATGLGWVIGDIENEVKASLEKDVNKALADSNKARTINIIEQIQHSTNSFADIAEVVFDVKEQLENSSAGLNEYLKELNAE